MRNLTAGLTIVLTSIFLSCEKAHPEEVPMNQWANQKKKSPYSSCQEIKSSNTSSQSGYYTIDPDGIGGNPPFDAFCDMTTNGGGWTVIDYNYSSVWANYFTSWDVFDNSRMAMPAVSTSNEYFVKWFTLADSETDFRISPECTSVNSTDGWSEGYSVSGNFYGCKWFNRNCDMNASTQECITCRDSLGRIIDGTCSHFIMNGDIHWNAIYEPYGYSCSGDWWNRNPSLGIAGKYCVAYRGDYEPPSFSWSLFLPVILSNAEDCNGEKGGDAYIDNCGYCVGGTTGLSPCEECSLNCSPVGFDYVCGLSRHYFFIDYNYTELYVVDIKNSYSVYCVSEYIGGPFTCTDNRGQSCIIGQQF